MTNRTLSSAEGIVDGFLITLNDDKPSLIAIPDGFSVGPEVEMKRYFYTIAAFSLAIGLVAKKRSEFLGVEFVLEQRMSSVQIDDSTKTEMRKGVKDAVRDLARLLSEKKELSWARDWLQPVGIDETNPASLALFSQSVIGQVAAFVNFLDSVTIAPS